VSFFICCISYSGLSGSGSNWTRCFGQKDARLRQCVASRHSQQREEVWLPLVSGWLRSLPNRKYGVSPATAAAAKLSKPSSPFDVLEQDAAKRAAAEQATQSGIADNPTKYFQGRLVDVDCSQSPARRTPRQPQQPTFRWQNPPSPDFAED
jgi:hypothetical protein